MKLRQLKRNILSAMQARLFYGHPIPQWLTTIGTDHYPRAKFMDPESKTLGDLLHEKIVENERKQALAELLDDHQQMCQNIEQPKVYRVAKKSTGEVMLEFTTEADAIECIEKAKRSKKAALVLV
jgi:hypothetical protein